MMTDEGRGQKLITLVVNVHLSFLEICIRAALLLQTHPVLLLNKRHLNPPKCILNSSRDPKYQICPAEFEKICLKLCKSCC